MKRIQFLSIAFFALTALFLTSCGNDAPKAAETAAPAVEAPKGITGDLMAVPAESKVMWKGQMLKMHSHEGTVAIKEGSLSLKDGVISGGKFVVDMTTITPTDSAYNKENTPAKLVGHLSTPDFFDVANNPTATFEITGAEAGKVMGNLTVRGKTNPETIENVVVTPGEGGATATGTLTFNRQKYGVAYKAAKDMILGDDIVLNISLVAKTK